MSERYVCWEKEHEEDPGTATTEMGGNIVCEIGVEWAAETYAEQRYNDSGEHVDEMTIMVRDPAGAVHEVNVQVEFSPTFSGSAKA